MVEKEEHNLDIYTLLQAINGWAKNHIELEKKLDEEIRSRCNWEKAHIKHDKAILELQNETTNLATYCVNNNETNRDFEKQIAKIVKYINKLGKEINKIK